MSRHALERSWEPDLDEARELESEIISRVVGEGSVGGVSIAELTSDLELNAHFRDFPPRVIEGAIQRLTDRSYLRIEGDAVRPGAIFGSALAPEIGPNVN